MGKEEGRGVGKGQGERERERERVQRRGREHREEGRMRVVAYSVEGPAAVPVSSSRLTVEFCTPEL